MLSVPANDGGPDGVKGCDDGSDGVKGKDGDKLRPLALGGRDEVGGLEIVGDAGLRSCLGIGTRMASAAAIVISLALWKRSSGCLAMLFKITSESSGEICGLISSGGVGILCMCCMRTDMVVSPRKGVIPVAIS